jgi:uncharacterized damage-inducible protein DinB
MIKAIEPMASEFREETAITRRVLERVPGDKLAWRPHPKSMALGQLALHIANIPANATRITLMNEFDVSQANFDSPAPKDHKEILATFEQNVRTAEEALNGITEQIANGNWRITAKGKELFSKPRLVALRSIMLSHWYHHRGQLSVYLRLLDVPVPVIYGRSADENPFG